MSGLKGNDLEWQKLRLDHLGGALALTLTREEDTAGIESTIGAWTKSKLFGTVVCCEGYPVSFVVAYNKSPKLVIVAQWGSLAEIEEKTEVHSAIMVRFLDSLPKYITCVSLTVNEMDTDQHKAAKAAGFKCISVLHDHFPGGRDGYLFTKRFDNKPNTEEEEEECLA